jgi:chromosome partitioning protein
MAKIAIFNQKGGISKTTSVLNIAGALYHRNNPALMIDMDPQGHLSQIHPSPINDASKSLYSYYLENTPLSELIVDWHHLGSLIPAHRQLAKVDSIFGKGPTVLNKFGSGLTLLETQNSLSNVLIDCCPYMGVLSLSALFTADLVLVPIASDFLSLQGAMKVEKTFTSIEPFLKRPVNRRYLMTRFDRRRNMSFNVQAQAIQAFGENVLDTLIFENVTTAESPNHKQDIFSFNAQSTGAANYMALLDELIAQNLVNTPKLTRTQNPFNTESNQTINQLSRHQSLAMMSITSS